MTQVIADRRDMDFVLHEQYEVGEFVKFDKFSEFNQKVIDMIITEARNLSVKEILPTSKIGDKTGCRYENGKVFTPEEFKHVWDLLLEGEWLAMDCPPEWGGQGMPETVAMAVREYLVGANMALMMFGVLNHGTGRLIETFGSDEQKALYLEKVYSGQWGATMLLTEPEAGSDLSGLSTTAVKNADGTYNITGSKMFITAGDHDLAENIIHPVLARMEGAAAGTVGISLFLVPKYRITADGGPGEPNDIVCTGIEEKMGIHGSPTCTMALGGKGDCIGTLLGQENRGMAAMFVMMNEARLMVGIQALACASSAYLYALEFARTRIQGSIPGSLDKRQVRIIHHPDIRRMLMQMKMYVEGMRSLLYFIACCEDRKHLTANLEKAGKYQNLIDILIPVAKAYVSDRAVDVCNLGVQVFGGYGYTCDYPVEQLLRDVRVTPIYEGTNGIQAMDLLARKLFMKEGRLLKDLIREIQKTVDAAKSLSQTQELAPKVEKILSDLGNAALHLDNTANSENILSAFAHACPFLEATGDVVMSWMLLWRAVIASKKLETKAAKKDRIFLSGQLKSAENFIRTILPVTAGKLAAIMDTCGAAVQIPDEAFGGK